jgi:cytochrome c biogenesis protein CcmG/thiol:disulfide interchange protein DsbE
VTRLRRSRLVLWSAAGAACLAAVLVAVLATSGPASQVQVGSPLVGKPAPAISGHALEGPGTVQLSSLRGKWVLVNFAASWCVPCREEMPQLSAFVADHAGAGNATVLTVDYDPADRSGLAAMLRGAGAQWPAVDDPSAEVIYGLQGLPESFLVDPQGTVVAKYDSVVVATQLNAEISKLSYGTA